MAQEELNTIMNRQCLQTICGTKTKALLWWNSMTFEEQFYKTIAWLKGQNKNTADKHPHNLTVDEIIDIHKTLNTQNH